VSGTAGPAANASAQASRRRTNNQRGRGELLREELLEAATALVADQGDARGLSLRAVAAGAGVAATSVYLHFADLDELKVALAQRYFTEFAAARDAAAATVTDPAEALVVRCRSYVRYALDNPGRYRVMFDRDLPPLNSAAGTQPRPSRSALDALTETIAACQHAGVAPADSSPADLAALLWSGLHGQASLRIDRPRFPWPPMDDAVREIVTRLVRLQPPTG
jgi:AcrR family transcriptional regulator